MSRRKNEERGIAMTKELEALKKLNKGIHTMTFCGVSDKYPFESKIITDKEHENMLDVMENNDAYTKCIRSSLKKYERYKNIENKLGIGLITLFKALENGIYVKLDSLDITFVEQVSMDNVIEEPCFYYCNENTINLGGLIHPSYTELYFKDYGKTWALSKEELL